MSKYNAFEGDGTQILALGRQGGRADRMCRVHGPLRQPLPEVHASDAVAARDGRKTVPGTGM